jgi:hypothetical protein
MGYRRRVFKHGIQSEDIDHALAYPLEVRYHDGYVMVLGSDRPGELLEVAVDGTGQVFHAMKARPTYSRRLQGAMAARSTKEMLHEIERTVDGQGPDAVAWTDDPQLTGITLAQLRLAAAEADLDAAVARARESGKSWRQIGDILGMTCQGAGKGLTA